MDRRAHARVAVPLDARVQVGGKDALLAVREISRSGIFLYTKEAFGERGAVLRLTLSIIAGIRPLLLDAQIVRVATDPHGVTIGMAMRFVNVPQEDQQTLLEMIERAMTGRGTGPRAYPRIAFLLNVRCKSSSELQGLLRDMGEGGAGLELPQALVEGAEVLVELDLPGRPALQLAGYVTSCERQAEKRFRVGIRFRKMTPVLRAELTDVLRQRYRR